MSDIAALVTGNLDIWTSATQRKSSAGRGGGKRISLYGIDRLRALILDLAVRGKLVAAELAVKQGSLGQVGDWVGGNGFPKQFQGNSEGEIPFLKVSDMNLPGNERLITVSNNFVSADELRAMRAKTHPAGTIIFPKIGGAIATNKRRILGTPSAIDNNCAGQVPRKGIDVDWLYMVLSSIDMAAYQSGTSVPALNMKRLAQHQIAIPKEADQHRIVAKVDELMALCDVLERESADAMAAHQVLVEELLGLLVKSADTTDLAANWARLESHFDTLFTTDASIDALKQAILDLAVRGKLVDEDAANWPVEPLGKYVKEAAAGWSPKCIETPRSGDNWGVLKVSAVTWGRFQPEENKELPSSLEPRPEIEVAPGDFLISRANTAELVARSVVVPLNAPRKLMMSDKIIRFRFNDKIDPEYVNLVHASPFARAYYARVAGGTSSSMKNVSQSQIRALEIPIPPLAEQHRIVAKVGELLALCNALKAKLADAAETHRHLADAIVERAAA